MDAQVSDYEYQRIRNLAIRFADDGPMEGMREFFIEEVCLHSGMAQEDIIKNLDVLERRDPEVYRRLVATPVPA